MGNAASELTDRLHLGRLGNLTLQLHLFAIVLEPQQYSGITQAAQTCDGKRNCFIGLIDEANRDIARHRLTTRIAPDRIRYCGFIFCDH